MIEEIKKILTPRSKTVIFALLLTLLTLALLETATLVVVVALSALLFKLESSAVTLVEEFFNYLNLQFDLSLAIALFAFLTIFSFLVRSVHAYLSTVGVTSIGAEFSKVIFHRYFNTSLNNIYLFTTSDIIANFTRISNVVFGIIFPFVSAISSGIISIMIIIGAMIVSSNSTFIFLLVIATFYIIILLFLKKINKRLGDEINILQSRRIVMISSLREMAREYRISSRYKNTPQSFAKVEKRFFHNQGLSQFISTYPRYLMEFLVVVLIMLYGYISTIFLGSNLDDFSSNLISLLYISQRLIPNAQLMYFSFSKIQNNFPQMQSLFNDLNDLKLDSSLQCENKAEIQSLILGNYFCKKNNQISTISKGDWLKIKGPSGSGKSVLIDYIANLRDNFPKEAIHFQRMAATENDSLIIAYVPSSSFLIGGTTIQNISMDWDVFAMGLNQAESVAFDRLQKLVGLDINNGNYSSDFDAAMLFQVERLSSGQKQRLAIARALFGCPDILIIDEGTSALDLNAEEQLLQMIRSEFPNITIIFVSHRSNTDYLFNNFIELSEN
jgi:ABC-type multidrug transport system fused ATPase/permease subunit